MQHHIQVIQHQKYFYLSYKREYQRRITQVYRADSVKKPKMTKEFKSWKTKAREQLKLYRENKITEEEFCTWIEKNKNQTKCTHCC